MRGDSEFHERKLIRILKNARRGMKKGGQKIC